MNAKRWFAWLCLALMVVTEIFLFRANHERDAARTALAAAQAQWHQAQADLDALKNSTGGAQGDELAGLRKQNAALTIKVNVLQQNVDQLQKESQEAAQHLTTARSALELQQENLQQIQMAQQQAAAVANANACISNLRQIDAAKMQWALEKNKSAADVPSEQDLLPYFKNGIFPTCPGGGTYAINAAGEAPTCSIAGHVLPPQ